MSAKEKSDLPEVAKKQSNKAASAAAETVERRCGATAAQYAFYFRASVLAGCVRI
jgi:hypothetical protein